MSRWTLIGSAAVFACWANYGAAQPVSHSPLLGMSQEQMRGEVEQRYEAAVKLSTTKEVIANTDTRYHLAIAAKVECGIAIGFLKKHQVDEDSVSKCDMLARLMNAEQAPPWTPPPPPPPPPPPVAQCTVKLPVVFYFGWDEDTPPADAQPVAAQTVAAMGPCGWTRLSVVGHTDLSGSLGYNQGLSERRAHHIADLLTAAGVQPGALDVSGKGKTQPAVATPDGVREPLNRRVEVTPAGGQ